MYDEELESDPRIQAFKEAADERRRHERRIFLAGLLIAVALAMFTYAWFSMAPLEKGDSVEYAKLYARAFDIKPQVLNGAHNLDVQVLLSGLKENQTEENVRAVCERFVAKAGNKKYVFQPGDVKAKPSTISIECFLFPMERLPGNTPALIRNVPSFDGNLPRAARLVWSGGAVKEWYIEKPVGGGPEEKAQPALEKRGVLKLD